MFGPSNQVNFFCEFLGEPGNEFEKTFFLQAWILRNKSRKTLLNPSFRTSTMVYRNKQQWFGIIFCIVLATQYLHCAAKFHFHKNRQGIIGICKRSLLQRDTCELDDKPKEKRKHVDVFDVCICIMKIFPKSRPASVT